MENPMVSVVIPFYNCEFVDQAVKSVLDQTYKNFEIILVDDGSIKNKDLLNPYMDRIQYIYKENGGTATALNVGIQAASGDLIAWLSSDDIFHPDKLQKQVEFMKKTKADLVYTNYNLINESNETINKNVGLVIKRRVDFLRQLQKSCPINGSTVLVKKEVLSLVGGFNKSLKYTQDYDMWNRIACKYHLEILNESLLDYRVHSNMGSQRFADEQRKEIEVVQEKYKDILDRLIYLEENGEAGLGSI
ncbi:glycosyltransferase [Bacillus seohaeanensis]|jgi:teichuronic acid biosynthesis glycosyltransferase TuaG|uniref:Glycosyltransferase n=1 Tax=Bacillus seohaeanensis TaxID=284580 RepID=A0ABW5RW12_9BACI